jgi:hypothetical protein
MGILQVRHKPTDSLELWWNEAGKLFAVHRIMRALIKSDMVFILTAYHCLLQTGENANLSLRI